MLLPLTSLLVVDALLVVTAAASVCVAPLAEAASLVPADSDWVKNTTWSAYSSRTTVNFERSGLRMPPPMSQEV